MAEKTTVQVSKATRSRLRSLGAKDVSFNQIITALLDVVDADDVMYQVYMMNREKQPELDAVQEKDLENGGVDFEKIFFNTMNDIALLLEEPAAPTLKPRKLSRARIRDRILHAETWPERDRLLRSLAAKCYDVAQKRLKRGDEDAMNQSLKWMKLTARFLGLGFTPKRLEDLDLIKRAVQDVKAKMRELEGEEEDGED